MRNHIKNIKFMIKRFNKVFKVFIIVSLYLFMSSNSHVKAQTYLYFQDSPDPELYDPSWMELVAPSELERKGSDLRKFPVESNTPGPQGINSLRLKWTSKSGGDWFAIAAGANWEAKNLSNTDTLSFYLYSVEGIVPANLPKVFFEDTQNNKSIMIGLTDYSTTLQANQWVRIKIPMVPFLTQANPIDYTQIKTVGFAQNLADNTEHTLLIDDVRVYTGNGFSPPVSAPQGLTAKGYDSHVFLRWNKNPESNVGGYEIYQSTDGGNSWALRAAVGTNDTIFTDFVRAQGTNLFLKYKINALNEANEPSGFSDVVNVSTYDMTDEQLLDMVEEATFRYFYDHAHPASGMARERNNSGNTVTSGGSGFGIMALLVGIERSFITRDQGIERILKIINFLENADRFHGVWSHWIDGNTGAVIPFSTNDNGGDLVETAFLAQGLLAARQYFDQPNPDEQLIIQKITGLWETIEWDWYRRNNGNYLYWHWSPDHGWAMNMTVAGPNESMIVYLLAIASPTHGVPASLFHDGWAASSYYINGNTFYGHKIWVGWDYGGPLFFTHYSFLGFDPRDIKDSYANYFDNNKNISLINRAYCVDNPKNYEGYGENCWGLTASDDPNGYSVHEPTSGRDNGTITPTAALSAMPYTPDESIAALKHFYRTLGDRIWGNFGFYDAFNQEVNWYATSYLAIDQGPIIDMIENYRSQLLWNKFMANPEIQPMLDTIGFVPNPSSIRNLHKDNFLEVICYPNPASDQIIVEFTIETGSIVTIELRNSEGILVKILEKNQHFSPGMHKIGVNIGNFLPGFYFVKLQSEDINLVKKLLIN